MTFFQGFNHLSPNSEDTSYFQPMTSFYYFNFVFFYLYLSKVGKVNCFELNVQMLYVNRGSYKKLLPIAM